MKRIPFKMYSSSSQKLCLGLSLNAADWPSVVDNRLIAILSQNNVLYGQNFRKYIVYEGRSSVSIFSNARVFTRQI
ncbi:rRNA 2'-O-methyltransferase fibrillarin 2, variant 2 [Dermatophagoides farinae]|uniref:rRNA 2'-O-methyltransferase fibrillarin 2, variant 2 n=1 Tax=Dermatophagoides farinae TaxID=6954 RepID=A0A922IF83_DERFA|nr:rRNA 2'-O-methyltransferase fibrillarin 2, variant 2 [Dermatophagoides farinae]